MASRYFALIIGIFFLTVGILGFIPNFVTYPAENAPDLLVHDGYGYLMGLFPVNILHNFVHLIVGIWGIASSGRSDNAQVYSRGLFVFYATLTILGLFPIANTTFGLIPIFGNNIWLHALTAGLASYFGFIQPAQVGQYNP